VSISSLLVRLGGDHPDEEDAMKYMMLIHQGLAPGEFERLPEPEQQEIAAAWGTIRETPGVTPGMHLQPPEAATTVRVRDGRTLTTDGPFAEIKEAIGGYLLFDAEDFDAAIELASRVPAVRQGGAVEVRPIVEW
jgi:hypothetical protein